MTRRYPVRTLWRDWQGDITAYVREGRQARAGWRGRLQRWSSAFIPSVICCLMYRISHWLYCHRCHWLAGTVGTVNHMLFSASISPASEIGGGLYLPHPAAVVLQARAGVNLRIYAGASVYCRPPRGLDGGPLAGTPELGANVVIGAKAAVSGPVRVGDGAVVSFNAIVREEVPAGGSALQSPLRNYRPTGVRGKGAA